MIKWRVLKSFWDKTTNYGSDDSGDRGEEHINGWMGIEPFPKTLEKRGESVLKKTNNELIG